MSHRANLGVYTLVIQGLSKDTRSQFGRLTVTFFFIPHLSRDKCSRFGWLTVTFFVILSAVFLVILSARPRCKTGMSKDALYSRYVSTCPAFFAGWPPYPIHLDYAPVLRGQARCPGSTLYGLIFPAAFGDTPLVIVNW